MKPSPRFPRILELAAHARAAINNMPFSSPSFRLLALLSLLSGSLPAQTAPGIAWSRLLSGLGVDSASAVVAAPDGTIWVAGSSTSKFDSPGPNEPYQLVPSAGSDVFVARYRPEPGGRSTLLYFTWLGGAGNEEPRAIALDGPGRVYIAGRTTSTDFPIAGNAVQNASGGNTDAFLTIIDPAFPGSGSLLYSGYHGGSGEDVATAIAVQPDGLTALVGYTSSDNLPGVGGSVQATNRGGWDMFLVKINPFEADSRQYSAYFGGIATDIATGVAFAPNGFIWVTGYSASGDFPVTVDGYRTTLDVIFDGFLVSFDTTQPGLDAHRYGTFIGGNGFDLPTALRIEPSGSFWVAGYTNSTDLQVTANAHQPKLGGGADGFVLRIDPTKPGADAATYYSYLGGRDDDVITSAALAPNGRLAVAGYTGSVNFPVAGPPAQPSQKGTALDGFASVLNPSAASGGLEYSTYVGGTLSDSVSSISVDSSGALVLAGSTLSIDYPVTEGERDPEAFVDGFVTRITR